MANIKIVTELSITIEPEVVEEYGITIVPLSVTGWSPFIPTVS